jgi:hypothetical protein
VKSANAYQCVNGGQTTVSFFCIYNLPFGNSPLSRYLTWSAPVPLLVIFPQITLQKLRQHKADGKKVKQSTIAFLAGS